MKWTSRELILGGVAAIALLVGITWWFAEPFYTEFKDHRAAIGRLHTRGLIAERLLEQQSRINERLISLRGKMPTYPVSQDVTSGLLKSLQRSSDAHGLILLRQEPSKERHVGELYELTITCSWEGSLKALIGFLYAVQEQGAIVDINQLTVSPKRFLSRFASSKTVSAR